MTSVKPTPSNEKYTVSNRDGQKSDADENERSMFNIGRQGEVNIINESGLYTLILRSDKPEAKKFRKWLTAEVLPTIRKTCGYNYKELANDIRNNENKLKLIN